uniref:Uncharacterized protein n=1 Tax=Strigamia maritima TaxID=126957 RepID=T1JDT9_STRMM
MASVTIRRRTQRGLQQQKFFIRRNKRIKTLSFRLQHNGFEKLPILKGNRKKMLFLFVICPVLFILQLQMLVNRYYSYPVSTFVSIKDVKVTYLPSISICNNNYRFVAMIERLMETNATDTLTESDVTNFWTSYGVQKNLLYTFIVCETYLQHHKLKDNCSLDDYSSGVYTNDTVFFSDLGQCVDMTLKYPVHQNILGFAIVINRHELIEQFFPIDEEPYYAIYAHENGMLYEHEIYVNTRIAQYVEYWVKFEKKEYIHKNSPLKPCQSVEGFRECWSKCVAMQIQATAPCRLPSSTASLPSCKSWRDVYKAHEAIDMLHSTGRINNCSCIKPCDVIEYKVNNLELMSMENNYSQFSVEILRLAHEVIEETFLYPTSHLIKDLSSITGFYWAFPLKRF